MVKFLGPEVANFQNLTPNYSQVQWECSKKALEKGHPIFGIEFFQECYTSEELDLSVQTKVDDPTCNKHGVGEAFKVSIFRI